MCVRACDCVLPGEISSLRRSKGERKWNAHPQCMVCLCLVAVNVSSSVCD